MGSSRYPVAYRQGASQNFGGLSKPYEFGRDVTVEEFNQILDDTELSWLEQDRVDALRELRALTERNVLAHIHNPERFGPPSVMFVDRTLPPWSDWDAALNESFVAPWVYFPDGSSDPRRVDGDFGGGGATGEWGPGSGFEWPRAWLADPCGKYPAPLGLHHRDAVWIECQFTCPADPVSAWRFPGAYGVKPALGPACRGLVPACGLVDGAANNWPLAGVLATVWQGYADHAGSQIAWGRNSAFPGKAMKYGQFNFVAPLQGNPADGSEWLTCTVPAGMWHGPGAGRPVRAPTWPEAVAPQGSQPSSDNSEFDGVRRGDYPVGRFSSGGPPDVEVVVPGSPGVPPVVRRTPNSGGKIKVGKNQKEHKLSLRSKLGRVWLGINLITEIEDALRAMHDAMPKKYQQPKWQPDGSKTQVRDMLPNLYRHGRTANFAQAIENLVNNEIEDWYYGWAIGRPGKFVNQFLGLPTGGNRIVNRTVGEVIPRPPKVDLTDTGVGMWWIDIG